LSYRVWLSESLIPVPGTQSAFHPCVRRNASCRRDARQQSRLFARRDLELRRSQFIGKTSVLGVDEFGYLSVLLSVILGLAVTQILKGFRGLLLSRVRIQL